MTSVAQRPTTLFHYGAFSRTPPLPEGVSSEISATHHDGILQVTMPAGAAAKTEPVRIKIGTGK